MDAREIESLRRIEVARLNQLRGIVLLHASASTQEKDQRHARHLLRRIASMRTRLGAG